MRSLKPSVARPRPALLSRDEAGDDPPDRPLSVRPSTMPGTHHGSVGTSAGLACLDFLSVLFGLGPMTKSGLGGAPSPEGRTSPQPAPGGGRPEAVALPGCGRPLTWEPAVSFGSPGASVAHAPGGAYVSHESLLTPRPFISWETEHARPALGPGVPAPSFGSWASQNSGVPFFSFASRKSSRPWGALWASVTCCRQSRKQTVRVGGRCHAGPLMGAQEAGREGPV